MRTIVSMPGDGIGKTVLPESIRLMEAAGFKADYVHADIGWEFGKQKETRFRKEQLICWKNTKSDCSEQLLPNRKMKLQKNFHLNCREKDLFISAR